MSRVKQSTSRETKKNDDSTWILSSWFLGCGGDYLFSRPIVTRTPNVNLLGRYSRRDVRPAHVYSRHGGVSKSKVLTNRDAGRTSLTFIEVCSGGGGLSSGFIDEGFHPILLNELDPVCCETLRKNHPNANVVCGSMVDIDLRPYRGKVDVLMGGVPCQSFSHAGHRKGLDDNRGDLIIQFRHLIDQVLPRVFLIENVAGLLTHNGGQTLSKVLDKLNSKNDYEIQCRVLNAWDYDVPQKRQRVIIVGIRKGNGFTYEYPTPSARRPLLRDVLIGCPKSQGYTYSSVKAAIMKLVPQGGCWVDLPKNLQKRYMGKSYYSSGGKRGIARRLSLNEPCLTLTTSPNQTQTERCHPTETRPLNVREYARIQTFPDSYHFCGSTARQYKQIGNAVPVKFARHLAISIKNCLLT